MALRTLLADLLRLRKQPQNPLALVLMRSSIGRHLEVFRELMELAAAGLRELGRDSRTLVNEFAADFDHIVFCPHLLRAEDVERVPPSTILYNFEPLDPPTFDSVGTFVSRYVPRFTVWDYSRPNVDYLHRLGHRAHHVPVGYAAVLSRIEPAPVQDIDVLFYGDVSPRRARVLDALRATGVGLTVATDVWGAERDALIARAKIVLNVHTGENIKALETPRIVYLLANRKAVVTELKADVAIDEHLRGAMAGAPYEGLAKTCVELVADSARRRALETAGFECVRRRSEAAILAAALGVPRP